MTMIDRFTIKSVLIGCVIGVIQGLMLMLLQPQLALQLMLVGFALVLMLKRAEFGLLAIVLLASTIFEERSLVVADIMFRWYATDLILLFLFLVLILRSLADREFHFNWTVLDVPLLAFLFLVLLSTAVTAVQTGINFEMALPELRTLGYYSIFFLTTNLIRSDEQITTLSRGLLILAFVVAIVMIAQFGVGTSQRILPGRVESLATSGSRVSDVVRITNFSGESLVLAGAIVLTAILFMSDDRRLSGWHLLLWLVINTGLMLTFNRNFWVAMVVTTGLIIWMASHSQRAHISRMMLVLLFCLGLGYAITSSLPGTQINRFVNGSVNRMFSVVDGRAFERDETLAWRSFEYEYGLPEIEASPLLGIGPGAFYRPYLSDIDIEAVEARGYTHNAHMWIAMKYGIPAYVLFVTVEILFIIRCFLYVRRINHPHYKILLGFGLVHLAVGLSSIVNPAYMQWYWVPVLAISMGMGELIIQRHRAPAPVLAAQGN